MMTRWFWRFAAGAAVLAGGGLLAFWTLTGPGVPDRNLDGLTGSVERGAYVARLSGCIACHTNAKAGGQVLAGGAGIETPFGTFHAPNITPHPKDGIGQWTLKQFSRAMTAGVGPDGRHYFPSFPYPFYTKLSDQEIADLWAAVRSVPPMPGAAPDHDLAFPFGFRAGADLWKRLFLDPAPLEPDPGRSDVWNRGRYLAEGPAHCGACHTPRNLLGGRNTGQRFAGGKASGNETVPAITAAALGARGWTVDDLSYALQTGIMPDGDVFGGSMAEVVRDGTRFWTPDDRTAIATYLMQSPAAR